MAALRMSRRGFLTGVLMALLLLHLGAPALSLVINTTTKGCSRECESRHCQDPFHLRYGKYCGVGYTGCAGEAACDGIDSCCLTHDLCIGSDLANYVNRSCNDQLKQCVERFQDANLTQFVGASCSATDLEVVIITMMNIATLGRELWQSFLTDQFPMGYGLDYQLACGLALRELVILAVNFPVQYIR